MDADIHALIEHFGLSTLPSEGTLFASTYRSTADTPSGGPWGTAIIAMYCAEPVSHSLFHRLPVDEVWHFYRGDPLRLILLHPDGSSRDVIMGNDPFQGHQVQFVVRAGVWQAGHVIEGGRYALFGCTMAPGFTGSMFEGGTRAQLCASHPDRQTDIDRFACNPGQTQMPDGFAS